MLTAALERHGNVKGPRSADGSSDSRHGDGRHVVKRNVSGRLGHEKESTLQAEKVPFVGLDRTLDSGLLVVRVEVTAGLKDLLSC